MGLGQSNNYNERDFDKKPLEEEEIDVLLEELPSSDKLKSLTETEKIKILKATSDEKIYNTVGDEIFNYHIKNNKEDIKRCIGNQFIDNRKSCPDKVISRIITQEPGIIKEPLQERIEKNKQKLQSKFNEEKMSFIEEKRQWGMEKNKLSNDIKTREKKYVREKKVFDEFWKNKETSWNEEKQNLTQVGNTYKSERDTSRANEQVLQTTLNTKEKQWADKQKSLEEERLEVTKGCNTATQKIITEKDNLQKSKNELQLEYETLESAKKTLKEQYDTLTTDKKTLKEQYDNLLSIKNDLDTQIVNLSTEKNNFKTERDEARTTGQTYKTERDEARTTGETYKTERDTYKSESEKLDKQVKELVLKIKKLSDPFGPYPISKNECMSSNVISNIHSYAKINDKFDNPGTVTPVSDYWKQLPSGCIYTTGPASDNNRVTFDTGADTFNNEANVEVPGACDDNDDQGKWCLPTVSYRVCKNADNTYKLLDSPKDKCSDNLFMVVGVNHPNVSDGTYFNFDLDAVNDSLKYFSGEPVNRKYVPMGGYEDKSSRAMRKRIGRVGKNDSRTQKCYESCKDYNYFALQDGDECFCENDLKHATKYGTKDCGKHGGPWCNYIYKHGDDYTVYNHRTNEIMDVNLRSQASSKSNYSAGITNKGYGRRTDNLAYFVPGDNLSFVNKIKLQDSGSPIDNMSEEECKAWADARSDKTWKSSGEWNSFGKGCTAHKKDMGVWYNKKDTGVECSDHMCVSKSKGIVAYPKIYTGNFEEIDKGQPAKNVSLGECKAYAVKNKLPWFGVEVDGGNFPPGCSFYKYKGYESNHGVRYRVHKSRDPKNCGVGQTTCIQKKLDFKVRTSGAPIPNVTEDECRSWADTSGGKTWTGTGKWPGDPRGCYTSESRVWYNTNQTSHDCGHKGYNCIER